MQLEFVTVDVFTAQKFGGNPLAVVLNAEGLTTAQMQAIAGEFNLAETTFVLPPRDSAHTAEVRIFTPKLEMPFAGHPNVGTAFAVAAHGVYGRAASEPLVFEEKAGLVRLDLLREGGTIVGARLVAPQPLWLGDQLPAGFVAKACSLGEADIETKNHTPRIASCGAKFAFAEVKTRRALSAAQPRSDHFAASLPPDRATGILLYTFEQTGDADIQARMFAPLYGVAEDPATGSAVCALAGLLVSLKPDADLTLDLKVSQGVDMGRPSLLEASADKKAGAIAAMRIGGRCVAMMRGVLEV
jgi:trans-2,3-dihydro-3-hydroxyanthranilate isomerase